MCMPKLCRTHYWQTKVKTFIRQLQPETEFVSWKTTLYTLHGVILQKNGIDMVEILQTQWTDFLKG